MTNSEILKQFSRVTGITDPVVEQIVRGQESWVYDKFADRNTTTYVAIDEGEPMAAKDVGIWAEYFAEPKVFKEQYEGNWKDFDNDYKPHKAQEEFHKSTKQYTCGGAKNTSNDRVDNMVSDMLDSLLYNFKDELNKNLWPNGRGAAFGDDEDYYDAEWREAEKPLMLPPHAEEEEDEEATGPETR